MGNLKKMTGLALAVAGLAMGALAPAASADEGYVDMWEDRNYRGDHYVHYRQGTGYLRDGWHDLYDFMDINWWDGDDEITSVINDTSKSLVLYAGDRPWEDGGKKVCIPPHHGVENLRSSNNFNDEAESFQLFDACP